MQREPHGEVLGLMTPCSNNSCNYFFTSSDSNMDCLYFTMFGKGESGSNSSISCSTSLLGGFPFGSYKKSLYA
nr:hypothetical protein Q903MT_gene2736 [Picea sitchensis]